MRIERGVNFFWNKLLIAVITIVTGIKNSTHLLFNRIISNTLNANVMECPIVKAVTKIKTCFQSFKT